MTELPTPVLSHAGFLPGDVVSVFEETLVFPRTPEPEYWELPADAPLTVLRPAAGDYLSGPGYEVRHEPTGHEFFVSEDDAVAYEPNPLLPRQREMLGMAINSLVEVTAPGDFEAWRKCTRYPTYNPFGPFHLRPGIPLVMVKGLSSYPPYRFLVELGDFRFVFPDGGVLRPYQPLIPTLA